MSYFPCKETEAVLATVETPTYSRSAEKLDPRPKSFYESNHLSKNTLVDGQWYHGRCRNSTQAVWRAEKQRFEYVRKKFDYLFIEEISAPEDEQNYDVFYALSPIPENEVERKIPLKKSKT